MLRDILVRRKLVIIDKWVQRILGYYPSESFKFLTTQRDRFANPVGYTISVSAGALFEELIRDGDPQVSETLLKDIVRIRAVQEFTPSQAIRFIFDLKEIVRGEIERESVNSIGTDELEDFEGRIDNLALISFDAYMEAREKLFRIRVDEVKARSLQAMVGNDVQADGENGRGGGL